MCVKKIVIDCDAGSDDAIALVMLVSAHKLNKIEIKGITCTAGNASLNNVVNNVFRTLQVCDALDVRKKLLSIISLFKKMNCSL